MSNSQDLTNTPSEVNQTDAQSGLRSSGIDLDYSNLPLSCATTLRPGVNDDYGTAAGEASGGMKDLPQVAVEGLLPLTFATAMELEQKFNANIRLTTGSKQFDELLGGGIEGGSITEIFGESRTGKTQICHTLAVTCQRPLVPGGEHRKCFYIDTRGTFWPKRLRRIADRFNMEIDDSLANVNVARAYNTDDQLELIDMAAALMSESRYSLLIVDSATALYRSDFPSTEDLFDRQIHMNKFMNRLQQLCNEFGVAVVITNEMVAQFDRNKTMKPVGGNIMAHASNTRVSLLRGAGERRICKLCNSPEMPEAEAMFVIRDDGIRDIDE